MNTEKFLPNPYKKIILASKSPRRRELLAGLDLDFEVKVIPGIAENYPDSLPSELIPQYIAAEKAEAYKGSIAPDEVLITADTVVILNDEIMGKPKDDAQAREMLHKLSGKTHQVTTGVCLTTVSSQKQFHVTSHVTFKLLSDDEIDYYVSHYHPLDKAGAYGIQEWIGYVGVTRLEGSFFNVMGLPVQRIWEELKTIK
ncbi:MAG: Maf-like protein [Prevotella sp.]|nr:Maf-like protein [Prevotella sp.]